MPTTMILCQEGTAELSRDAKRNAQRLGIWMQENALIPDRVVALSRGAPLLAAEKMLKAAGRPVSRIQVVEASNCPERTASCMGRLAKLDRVLVVGPRAEVTAWLEEWRSDEAWEDEAFPGDGILVFGASEPEQARIRIDPADLPRDFPFPTEGGEIRRPRPAYYYRQSGVIPFRVTPEEVVEVLLITSSSGRKWGLPKGIHEPGLSATGSATIEAFEEAGILGEVVGERVGTYRAKKWGGSCEVTMFAFRVLLECEAPVWMESRRQREWLPVGEAADRVTSPELAALLLRLPESLPPGTP